MNLDMEFDAIEKSLQHFSARIQYVYEVVENKKHSPNEINALFKSLQASLVAEKAVAATSKGALGKKLYVPLLSESCATLTQCLSVGSREAILAGLDDTLYDFRYFFIPSAISIY